MEEYPTIAHYKMEKWMDDNFERGSVKIIFTGQYSATIKDKQGDTLEITYDPKTKTVSSQD